MSLQCRKTTTPGVATGPTKARWMTAATLVFSVSYAASFSSNLPHRNSYAIQTSPRYVMADPDTLLRETGSNYSPFSVSAPEPSQEFLNVRARKTSKQSKQNIIRTGKSHFSTEEELSQQTSSEKPVFKSVSLQKRQVTRSSNSDRGVVPHTATMPGFSNIRPRERDFEVGFQLAESRSGRNLRRHLTTSVFLMRKQANAEAMYRASDSVPESLIVFSKEIHKVDRITAVEECELGTLTQEAVRLQNLFDKLSEKLGREPKDEEWCAAAGKINLEAIQQAMEEGIKAKNKLVTANLRMVQGVVNIYIRNGLGRQYNAGDMMQEGVLALIRAAEKYEPNRGFRFSTYALYGIRAAVKRSQTIQSSIIPLPHRLHANYKKVRKTEVELKLALGRKPTGKELGAAVGMSEMQIQRCLRAMNQEIISMDAAVVNTAIPFERNGGTREMHDLLGTMKDDEERTLQQLYLREDLIETLKRHLTETEVKLLMLRYGMMEKHEVPPGYEGSLTITEVSKLVGLKPDKVRRMLLSSLEQMKSAISDEWVRFDALIQ